MRIVYRVLIVFALVLSNVSLRAEVPTLQNKVLLGGQAVLLIPAGFRPLSPEELLTKYPAAGRPSLVYSDATAAVTVAIDHTTQKLRPDQLGEALKLVKAQFEKAAPNGPWYRSELTKIHGREFFLLELRTPSIAGQVRNIIAGTSMEGRLLLVAFNTMKTMEAEWLPVGNQIIQSIKLSDRK